MNVFVLAGDNVEQTMLCLKHLSLSYLDLGRHHDIRLYIILNGLPESQRIRLEHKINHEEWIWGKNQLSLEYTCAKLSWTENWNSLIQKISVNQSSWNLCLASHIHVSNTFLKDSCDYFYNLEKRKDFFKSYNYFFSPYIRFQNYLVSKRGLDKDFVLQLNSSKNKKIEHVLPYRACLWFHSCLENINNLRIEKKKNHSDTLAWWFFLNFNALKNKISFLDNICVDSVLPIDKEPYPLEHKDYFILLERARGIFSYTQARIKWKLNRLLEL